MISVLLLPWLCFPGCVQESPHAMAMEALGSEDYARAWSLLDAEPDDYWRASGRTFVLYGAGDYGQTITHAEQALALGGDDLNLLYRAAWAALLLGEERRATDFVLRLQQATEGQEFSPEHASFWDRTMQQLEPRLAELRHASEQRSSALLRARLVSLGSLLGVLLLIGYLGRE